ncbi:hypothetical protein WJX74_003402 [Apatococcus lobatus]|uniref:Metallothionein n=1 Tax=Apatococcus lobatus TaxID=904363 RepID=A0AAW1RYH7_9CHLO
MSSAIAKQIEKSTNNPGGEDSKVNCDACAGGCQCVTVQKPDQDLRGCQCGKECNCPHCPGQQAFAGMARKMEGDQNPTRIGG